MRFRLRTLMILLAMGPPALAGAWYLVPHRSVGWALCAMLVALAVCLTMFWLSLVNEPSSNTS